LIRNLDEFKKDDDFQRLEDLAKIHNGARNLLTRIRLIDPKFLTKLYKDAKNNALVNAFNDHTKMKSLIRQVRGESKPVNAQDMIEYQNHLNSSGVEPLEGFKESLGKGERFQTNEEVLKELLTPEAINKLDALDDKELIRDFKNTQDKIDKKEEFKAAVEKMKNCMIGEI
jgi:hypothetical protein